MSNSDPRMVTPLDLPLVRRVLSQRLPLDMAAALTRGTPGLEDVLLSSVPLADLGAPTLVLRDGESGYVGQFRQYADKTVAHITFLAPDPQEGDVYDWARLLEAITFEAGKRSAHVINAEVTEGHPVGEAFRLAGFAVYSRQVILRREPGLRVEGNPVLLRRELERDTIGISTLHTNTVPRLLQQAEPLPAPACNGLIYERDGQIAGYLAVSEGKSGVVIKPYFHPEVYEQASAIIMSALMHVPRARYLPVYLYARAYQDRLRGALDRVGFKPWTNQAVMAKYTLVRIERMEPVTIPGLDTGRLRPPATERPIPLPKITLWPRPKDRPTRLLSWRRNGK